MKDNKINWHYDSGSVTEEMAAQTRKTNIPGLSVTKNDEGIWINIEDILSKKKCSINMNDMADVNIDRIVGQAIKGWCDELMKSDIFNFPEFT